MYDEGGRGRRRRRATFDQTVIRGSEPHDMIRRGNICSTERASHCETSTGLRFEHGRKGVSDVFRESTRRRPLPSKCLSVERPKKNRYEESSGPASTVFYSELTGGNGHGLCWEATREGRLRSRRGKIRIAASRSFFDAVCFGGILICPAHA